MNYSTLIYITHVSHYTLTGLKKIAMYMRPVDSK